MSKRRLGSPALMDRSGGRLSSGREGLRIPPFFPDKKKSTASVFSRFPWECWWYWQIILLQEKYLVTHAVRIMDIITIGRLNISRGHVGLGGGATRPMGGSQERMECSRSRESQIVMPFHIFRVLHSSPLFGLFGSSPFPHFPTPPCLLPIRSPNM